MSPATYATVLRRARVSHAKTTAAQKLKNATVWYVLAFWRASVGAVGRKYRRPWWCKVRGPKTKALCMKQTELINVVKTLTKDISDGMVVDLATWCTGKSREMEEASLQGNKRALYALLRCLEPWKPRRDFRICDADGNPTTTDLEERAAVRDHFQKKLEATPATMEELIVAERSGAVEHANEVAGVKRSLAAVPSVTFLVTKYAHGKNGTGEIVTGGEAKKLLA